MPIPYNNKIAVRKEELIGVFFNNLNHLSVTLQREQKKSNGIRKLQSGGNGRELLIDFDSLPLEIRKALGDPREVKDWMDKFFVLDDDALEYYQRYRFDTGYGLPSKHITMCVMNASTLNACVVLRKERERMRMTLRGSATGIGKTIWTEAMNYKKTQTMKYGYCHNLPDNERRFLDKLITYEKEGFGSLISKKFDNKNAVKVTADVVDLLNNLFAGRLLKPSSTDVWREYTKFLIGDKEVVEHETGELISPKNYPELSETTVLGYLAKWEAKIANYKKRSGNRQIYMNDFKTTHTLDKPQFAGSLLSVDDRNPPFMMENGERVWFYNAIDVASECWVGWVHGKTKEGIIRDFYRQLLRNYAEWGFGLPRELECESSLNSTLLKGILQDGVMFEKVRMEANNATGKIIERYFEYLRYGPEKQLDGWLARPFAKSEPNQKGTGKEKRLSYDTITCQSIKVMQDWNNEPHPTMKDKTRWEVFRDNQNPKCKPICWEVILPTIGYETKTSCHTGEINLNREKMLIARDGKIATGNTLIASMKIVEGKELKVFWLDDNEGNVLKAFAYIDSRVVCELIKKPSYNRSYFERIESEHGGENYALMSAYSNTITAFGTRESKKVRQVTVLEKTILTEYAEVEMLEEIVLEQAEFEFPKRKVSMLDRF